MKVQQTAAGAIAVLIIAGLAASTAYSDDNRAVVRSSNGVIVHSHSGACVRIDWLSDNDACAPAPQKAIFVPSKRTIIAKADRTVYFNFNSAELTEESRIRLNTLAEKLSGASDIQGARVAGYADRLGTRSYNDALSKKRAEAVRDYLIAHKVINTRATETRWFGKSEPKANCPANLPRPQLIQCLEPDRKVQVDIDYRVDEPAPAKQVQ